MFELLEQAKEAAQRLAGNAVDAFKEAASSPEALQAIISSPSVSNDQLFDLVAKQSPELADLAQTIKNDPELAQSFRNALQKDPSMLEGLSALGQDGSNLNIDDLNAKLQDPKNRSMFGDVLDKIAESPDDNFNFATLTTLAGHIEKGENDKAASLLQTMGIPVLDGMGLAIQFFTDLMQNPEMAVLNLVNSLEGAGMIDEQMGNQIMSFAPELAGFAKFMVEPYHNLVVENNITMDSIKNIPNAMAESGADRRAALEGRDASFEAGADRTGETQDTREHASGTFDRATTGKIDPEAVSANPRPVVAPEVAATTVSPALQAVAP